ncbi:hypothetical protein Hanom_Chr05g00437711 [Helianthus anomalus]
MHKCLDEIPESLIANVLPVTTRPILITEFDEYSRVSPALDPFSIISFKVVFSIDTLCVCVGVCVFCGVLGLQ